MTYTIWHAGIMIGECAFDHPNPLDNPQQRAGTFIPTAYGRELFPRLTGIMTASADLKDHLEARGLDPDAMDRDAMETEFMTTAAGQKIIDIGRALSEVEIRDDRSRPLEFKQIAFIDYNELRALTRRIGGGELDRLPTGPESLIVSATLARNARWHHAPVPAH